MLKQFKINYQDQKWHTLTHFYRIKLGTCSITSSVLLLVSLPHLLSSLRQEEHQRLHFWSMVPRMGKKGIECRLWSFILSECKHIVIENVDVTCASNDWGTKNDTTTPWISPKWHNYTTTRLPAKWQWLWTNGTREQIANNDVDLGYTFQDGNKLILLDERTDCNDFKLLEVAACLRWQ